MYYQYKAQMIRTVDADTLDLDVDLGFGVHMDMRVRVARIDAWEVRGEEREKGLAAEDWVNGELDGKQLRIKTDKDKKGKYGRYIAEILYDPEADGYVDLGDTPEEALTNLSDALVKEGHATYESY